MSRQLGAAHRGGTRRRRSVSCLISTPWHNVWVSPVATCGASSRNGGLPMSRSVTWSGSSRLTWRGGSMTVGSIRCDPVLTSVDQAAGATSQRGSSPRLMPGSPTRCLRGVADCRRLELSVISQQAAGVLAGLPGSSNAPQCAKSGRNTWSRYASTTDLMRQRRAVVPPQP